MNRIADELNRASEIVDIPVAPIARVATAAPRVANASEQAVDRLFAENRVWSEPAASRDVAIVAEPRPDFEPIATVADASGIGDELNRASEGIDLDPGAVATRTPRRPRFEPIEVMGDALSLADELNRASEGLTTTRDAEPTIRTALKLTHEAALAWLNVLTKTMSAEDAALEHDTVGLDGETPRARARPRPSRFRHPRPFPL